MQNLNEIVEQFQDKDENAFEKLYEMYSESIHGVIFNIVKNKSLADELTQETFIEAWKNASSYSIEKGRFFTWILKMARNTAMDKIRSNSFKQSKMNLNIDSSKNSFSSPDNLNESSDPIGIRKLLPTLSSKRCTIIELLFIKGFTQKEVSDHLDKPIRNA
ncbi:RNA polymerase sigma factor [Winogradskyella forsetii]|uniref:RNA polymerase sigma factor n=1 Tax=Winogradskyella forsetii TaxID=2686077 RepID=UPI0015BC4771|nr:sigma-70 family RNA polymerase sigma factor [Winogradskyella forsetii]